MYLLYDTYYMLCVHGFDATNRFNLLLTEDKQVTPGIVGMER